MERSEDSKEEMVETLLRRNFSYLSLEAAAIEQTEKDSEDGDENDDGEFEVECDSARRASRICSHGTLVTANNRVTSLWLGLTWRSCFRAPVYSRAETPSVLAHPFSPFMSRTLDVHRVSPIRGQLEPYDPRTPTGCRYIQITDTPDELKVRTAYINDVV